MLSPFKLALVPFPSFEAVLPGVSYPKSISLPQPWNPPLIQGVPASLIGRWLGEADIWMSGVFTDYGNGSREYVHVHTHT